MLFFSVLVESRCATLSLGLGLGFHWCHSRSGLFLLLLPLHERIKDGISSPSVSQDVDAPLSQHVQLSVSCPALPNWQKGAPQGGGGPRESHDTLAGTASCSTASEAQGSLQGRSHYLDVLGDG